MADVVHCCPRGHLRSTAYCGACQQPTDPHCAGCGHNLHVPGHPEH